MTIAPAQAAAGHRSAAQVDACKLGRVHEDLTMGHYARELLDRSLHVVTNSLPIAEIRDVASKTDATVNDKPVIVGVNAYIKP